MALTADYEMTPMDKLLANACPSSINEHYENSSTFQVDTCCVIWKITAKLVDSFINEENPDENRFQYEILEMVTI